MGCNISTLWERIEVTPSQHDRRLPSPRYANKVRAIIAGKLTQLFRFISPKVWMQFSLHSREFRIRGLGLLLSAVGRLLGYAVSLSVESPWRFVG